MLEAKFQNLKEEIHGYYLHVEKMYQDTITGILNHDTEVLTKIVEIEEPLANEKELKIDELCIDLLALYGPRGKQLRTIIMIMKMNNDLERIADHCVNISESALRLIHTPGFRNLSSQMLQMTDYVKIMLYDAFYSFANEDTALAKDVLKRDDIVDDIHHQNVRNLVSDIEHKTQLAETFVDLLLLSSNLERIADLATNIAEDVIYIVEGKTYKHGKFE